jgi:hypothetical protein
LTKPYSDSASTAYWLQVGMNRHVGNRMGDTYLRYNSITRIMARAGNRRILVTADVIVAPSAKRALGSDLTAVPVRVVPRSRVDCSAALG